MGKLRVVKLLQHCGSITALLQAQFKKKPTQEQIDYFWLKLCEERYKYDFEFYAATMETIEEKETAELIPFVLNPAQRLVLAECEEMRLEGLQILLQILKAKQMGFSTFIQMYMKWIQIIHKENWNSVVVAHIKDASLNVRSIYERSIKNMPAIGGVKYTVKPFANTQNIKEIPERGCRITVGTALEPESVRSQNVKMIHFSEEAFYPSTAGNNPELLEAALISSSTKGPYTMIVRESTANGEGDYFHEQWLKAKNKETAFRPIFAPFFIISMYEELFDGKYYQHNGRKKKGTVADFIGTLNEYEWNLWNNHKDCTLENLNWRRMQAATMPSETKMKQEYPADDMEAFQSSGSPVFNMEHIERLRPDCCLPEAVGTLSSKCDPAIAVVEPGRKKDILKDIGFVPDKEALRLVTEGDKKERMRAGENKLWVWQFPDTTKKIRDRYVVSFDPQRGQSESADYGVIKVFDRYWMMHGGGPEVVAMFYGHIDKDITIWMAAQVAKWYNNAVLVVESNVYDSGLDAGRDDETEFIFDTIAAHYDNLYSRTPADKIIEGVPAKYGFRTDRNTKPMLISTYKGIIREDGYTERDEETLNEARTFEVKPDGSTGAKVKRHDDRIMSTMIGLYVCYQIPKPFEAKTVQGNGRLPEINTKMAW